MNDVTLEGLSKCVEYTKSPSALAYDEINIHIEGLSNYEGQVC